MPGINLKKNILLGGSSRLLIMGLSFLCSWISARFLGVELKGQYSYLVTLGGFIWMALDLGLYRSYPYLIRKNPDKLNSLLGWTILSFVLETLLLAVLGLGLLRFWNSILGFVFDPLIHAAFHRLHHPHQAIHAPPESLYGHGPNRAALSGHILILNLLAPLCPWLFYVPGKGGWPSSWARCCWV